MKIFGLVGKSGTGKSHHAQDICRELGIECIIDDGLLIYRGRVKAGFSAKFESNSLAAIRRALFTDPIHRRTVRCELDGINTSVVLIIGTSRHMIELITKRLELSSHHINWMKIDDFINPSLLQRASRLRSEGKHAIPIEQPYIESRWMLASFVEQVLRRVRITSAAATVVDASPMVVRPIFVDGSIYLHRRALRQSIEYFIADQKYLFTVRRLYCDTKEASYFQLSLHALWQENLIGHVLQLHREVCRFIRESMGFPYPQVDIRIESISAPEPGTPTGFDIRK